MTGTADLTIPVEGTGGMRVAVALPPAEAGDPVPGVVVVHEAWGLNDDIRAICARFARHGYAAVAPDLWSAGSRLACLNRIIMEPLAAPGAGPVFALVEAARRHLAGHERVDPARMAVIGFCMGGGFALSFGAGAPVSAASVNYGRVPRDGGRLARVCPVVASFGAGDASLRGAAERLERHLADYGVPADVRVYEGAGHGFMNAGGGPRWLARLPAPLRQAHQPAAAEDAWRRIFAFFDQHVAGA